MPANASATAMPRAHRARPRTTPWLTAALLLALTTLLAACGGNDAGSGGGSGGGGKARELRLGYFPNLTHATALVGVEKGVFQRELGDTKLVTSTFNAGPAATEALFSDAIDATYIGPNPAINAFIKSHGEALRIVSGATSGGAYLVVKPTINAAADLKGKKLATPQLGNTQDVALRDWLARNGLNATKEGGGDVAIVPQENAQTLETFTAGAIDGAWVPEPWATRLQLEGKGKVLVDEKTLWPDGRYVTTHLVVRTKYLTEHPDAVEALLRGQVKANELVNSDPATAQQLVNDGIVKITGKALKPAVIQGAWKNLTFTNDPVAGSLRASAAASKSLGFIKDDKLDGIYDLGPLNKVLKADGKAEVNA